MNVESDTFADKVSGVGWSIVLLVLKHEVKILSEV